MTQKNVSEPSDSSVSTNSLREICRWNFGIFVKCLKKIMKMEKSKQSISSEEEKSPVKFFQLRSAKMMTGFHIKETLQCSHLDELINTQNQTLNNIENAIIDSALDRFRRLGRGWNEEELKMHFISPILNIADVNIIDVCKTFFERPLSGIINNYALNVVTDCMIAGYNEGGEPTNPYFFLQEFKQSQTFGRTDPQGQMLAAMLLAQQINKDDKPLYGCYVIEKNWYFTTLLRLNYCVSEQYNSTKKEDLLQIVFILRKLKELILNR
jgi:hypothetical protein